MEASGMKVKDLRSLLEFGVVRIVDKDWVVYHSDPWERIPEYVEPVVKLLCEAGTPTRQIARIIGFDRRQVRLLIRKNFPEVLDAKCACGLTRRHQGWCRVRYAQSKVRQKIIRELHARQYVRRLQRNGWTVKQVASFMAHMKDLKTSGD
jgi:hypothetical protein